MKDANVAGIDENGFELFIRFAEGCRCYLISKKLLPEDDNKILDKYFRERRITKQLLETIKKTFYVAYPGLERVGKQLRKSMFDPQVVREFYAFEHNEMKLKQGEAICLAYPAKIVEKHEKDSYMIELKPIHGRFWVKSDIRLDAGDWVIIHRLVLVEKISSSFAERVVKYMENLGLKRDYKFPKKSVKYMESVLGDAYPRI